jgi:hypothetical protein
MKLIIIYFAIAFTIINGVRNAPAIHPIRARTIPVHPVTSDREPTGRPITPSHHPSYDSSSSTPPFTDLTSSAITPSATTHRHHSWWGNRDSVLQIVCRIFLYVFLIFLLSKLFGKICKSKKPNNVVRPVVVKNKMCVSTINGQREEPPPAYTAIHKV